MVYQRSHDTYSLIIKEDLFTSLLLFPPRPSRFVTLTGRFEDTHHFDVTSNHCNLNCTYRDIRTCLIYIIYYGMGRIS